MTFVSDLWCGGTSEIPLYGLVLAGGESRRMKRAKWALAYRGEPHALYVRRVLSEHCDRAFVSLRAEQTANPAFDQVPLITDSFVGMGPMGGILSAMETHPGAAWLVLACDLPHIDGASVRRLLARRAPFKLATSYRNPEDGLPEPLCTIYEPKARLRLLQALALGHRSPREVLIDGEIALVPTEAPGELANANHPHEYDEAVRSLRN